VILRLSLATAELVGENPAEWQALENCVRLGQWTSGPRADESRLLQIVAELRAPLRVEGIALLRSLSLARRVVAEVLESRRCRK
jgi:hypothetical protein